MMVREAGEESFAPCNGDSRENDRRAGWELLYLLWFRTGFDPPGISSFGLRGALSGTDFCPGV